MHLLINKLYQLDSSNESNNNVFKEPVEELDTIISQL